MVLWRPSVTPCLLSCVLGAEVLVLVLVWFWFVFVFFSCYAHVCVELLSYIPRVIV